MNSIEVEADEVEKEKEVVVLKKRGRKSKQQQELQQQQQELQQQQQELKEMSTDVMVIGDVPPAKKRGRKPKGGKIIPNIMTNSQIDETTPNIILHLKCATKDLLTNATTYDNLEIESYNFSVKNELSYEVISKQSDEQQQNDNETEQPQQPLDEKENMVKMKDTWVKLKQLEHTLHINNVSNKRSACFWCTYEFDNPAVYIPKHYVSGSYHVYGCFCSPECGVAYLMNESIDSSVRFERYQFLNNIYGKVFNYEKNIKPAPNPYYMLEKFCGNLSIQEYRALLRNERLFLIIDKPLTRILPELHEDNDNFILNNKIIPSNYQLKKKIAKKGGTKNSIVHEHFGIV